ncbi:uncharacterized protein DFL_008963 [Arthrobotrys flagrans]|uniref:Uncharacterized protein n=1 Tax=Arthrobotrys flagrans TaxID=97331 RepID=A0A436ZQJ6_ARTFL|nr:hypothetical protein DFL_008963 [Arthrobotrys flagrans]
MKLLTANFLSCAVKACKSSPLSFPLHFRDAELASKSVPYNPLLLSNLLPRLDWPALVTSSKELGFTLPDTKPELPRLSASSSSATTADGDMNMDGTVGEENEKTLRMLHKTVGNFLLPSHLV